MVKQKKFLKKVSAVLCIVFLLSIMGLSVYALTVTRYAQEKTNWCWAASGEMVFNYISSSFSKGTFSSRQQRIVSLGGKDPSQNQTGSVVHIVQAGKEIFKSGGEFNNASYYSLTDTSFSTITSALSTKPIVISAYVSDLSVGHTMVAYMYDTANSEIRMHDPWSGASTIYVTSEKLVTGGFLTGATGQKKLTGKYYINY